MAEKTRRAYGSDVGELARWAAARAAPGEVDYRLLRRYAAHLSATTREGGRALSARSVARKFASIRAFYRHMVERGELSQNPADLVSHARRQAPLPKLLRTDELTTLLDRIPARTPLEMRDRAMLELTYSCGLRCEEVVNLDDGDLDFDAEELRVTGKGSKTRIVPVGEPAQRALETLPVQGAPVPGPGSSARRACGAGVVLVQGGPPPVALGRAPPPAAVAAQRGPPVGRLAARAAPFLRHPPARRRGGSARDPGAAGPQQRLDYPDLHSGRVSAAAPPVQPEPPAGVGAASHAWTPEYGNKT